MELIRTKTKYNQVQSYRAMNLVASYIDIYWTSLKSTAYASLGSIIDKIPERRGNTKELICTKTKYVRSYRSWLSSKL